MLPVRSILHPTDFSPHSAHAFRLASALARDYGARLVLLYVWQPPLAVYGEMALAPDLSWEREAAEEKLNAMEPHDPAVICEKIYREGDAADEIVRIAKETPCDVIVMGTHGRRGVGRLLMGSVAEAVLRRATCPVLTVKLPEGAAPEKAHSEKEAVHA